MKYDEIENLAKQINDYIQSIDNSLVGDLIHDKLPELKNKCLTNLLQMSQERQKCSKPECILFRNL